MASIRQHSCGRTVDNNWPQQITAVPDSPLGNQLTSDVYPGLMGCFPDTVLQSAFDVAAVRRKYRRYDQLRHAILK